MSVPEKLSSRERRENFRESVLKFMLAASGLPQCICKKILDRQRRLFGDPYLLTKFRGGVIYRLEIIANFIFRQCGLRIPIRAPKIGVLGGDLTPNRVQMSTRPQKSASLCRRASFHQARKSADGSDLWLSSRKGGINK